MPDLPTLTFYGAAGTVTGSKYHLQFNNEQILLDAGLFQGLKELRLRNWGAPPFDCTRLQAVILSHAHIDHSGYLPVLTKYKFRGPVFCTSPTADLLDIMLKDAAKLQEEDARFANKRGFSRHKPALPLYDGEDVKRALERLRPQHFGKKFQVTQEISATFHRAGHILGAAIGVIQIGRKDPVKLVFSGDLGRRHQPILLEPDPMDEADFLLLESTYGNRMHPKDALDKLAAIVRETAAKDGVLVIPAFAVGRTQELIWYLRRLEEEEKIPVLPVFVDSPMATEVTEVYAFHDEEHDSEMDALNQRAGSLRTRNFTLVESHEDSKRLNRMNGPMIVISSSGMATGGRVLHHLEHRIEDEKNTILLAGFQAAGTRGRTLKEGAKELRFYGRDVPVRARVEALDGLSAHADQEDIMEWLKGFKRPPKKTWIVHGEPASCQALAEKICSELGWDASAAQDGATVELG